jgi:hypothetical protein
MRYLRTNTAARVSVGPFIGTDGLTPSTALTVTSEKLTLTVDVSNVPTLVLDTAPTASGGANDMVHVTGDDAGMYDLELAAANVNYLGRAVLILTNASAHVPVWHEFMILPAMVYDSLVLGTDTLNADTTQWNGTNVATPATAGYPAVTHKVGTGTGEIDITSGVVKSNVAQFLGTAITETSGQIAAAFTKFFNKSSPTGTINSIPDAVAGAANGLFIAGTNAATTVTTAFTTTFTGNLTGSVASVTGAVGSVTGNIGGTIANHATIVEDAVWDAVAASHVDAGSFGELVGDIAVGSPPTAAAIADAVWDEVSADHVTAGTTGYILANVAVGTPPTAAAIADAVWDEAVAGHVAGGSFGATDAAIKAKTDSLTFTVANKVDANTQQLAGQTVTAAAGVTFPTSVASPTNITAGTITTVTTVTTAEALGTQAKADVNAEVDDAINDAALATAANLALTRAVVDAILVDTGTTLDQRIPAALSAGGNMKADIQEVNGVTIVGDGDGTPWGPA